MDSHTPPGLDLNFLQGLRLLYVEDEDEVRELLSRFLGRRVGTLEVAVNGREGLEAFLKGEYDVVVTDIKMPEMDGLEMASRIRATGHAVPIIVVTAYSDRDYLLRSIALRSGGQVVFNNYYDDMSWLMLALGRFRHLEEDAGGKTRHLTKAGSDLLKAIRDAGGYTVAQDEASCVVYGMPREAVALGAAEEVLDLAQIAETLMQQVRKRGGGNRV